VPFGVETGEPAWLSGIFHPAGTELTVAKAMRSNIHAFGIGFDGNAAASRSSFSWAGVDRSQDAGRNARSARITQGRIA
jgi:hypothetical protein